MRIRELLGWRQRHRALDEELDEELEYHLARVAQRLTEDGLSEADAHRAARARFGSLVKHRHAIRRIDRKGLWTMTMKTCMRTLGTVASTSLRNLTRSPALSANIIAILALGIGANAVMFGVVDRLLLRPPQHVEDPSTARRLYVGRTLTFNQQHSVSSYFTFPDYRDMREVDAFRSVGAFANMGTLILGRGASAEEIRVKSATATFFPTLGVPPRLGRFFAPEEDRVGAAPVAVITEEFWERRFGRTPDILGRTLDIGNAVYDVIGVAPAGFTGADLRPVDVWLPLETAEDVRRMSGEWREQRGNWWLHVVARLGHGATDASASTEATAVHVGARSELIAEDRYSADATITTASLIAARGPAAGDEPRVALWLAGVSAVVLLIACFNVANLLLARATRTHRDTALRRALGAGRGELVLGVLMESLAYAVAGSLLAIALAGSLGTVLHERLLPGVAFTDTGLWGRVALFAGVAALLTGLLSGTLPAFHATRGELTSALKSGGRGVASSGTGTRKVLLIAQAAMSVVLLVGAGLFVRSLGQAQELDLGFDSDRIAVVDLSWNETLPAADRAQAYREVLGRLRALPTVREAALTYTIPFWSSISIGRPRVPGLDSIPRHRNGGPYANKVGDRYFETMGLAITQGRAFDAGDETEGAEPVTIVSASMAQAIWPDVSPLGQCMMLGSSDDGEPPCTRVVGVVENHRRQDLVEDDPHFLYFLNEGHPAFQGPPQAILARVAGDASEQVAHLAAEARPVSPLVRFASVRSLRDLIDPQLRSWRLGATLFTLFGLLAMGVAGWGLYSVLAFDVARRRMEIGVRSALGADTRRIVRMVLARAILLTSAGVAVGLVLALAGSRFVEPLLFRVSATDPVVYGAVTVVILLVALVAGCLPAFRATEVQPTEALRAD